MTLPLRLLLVLMAALAAGCSDVASPTAASSTDPATFTFASSFTAKGSASRSFEQLTTGAVGLTLTAVSPDVPLGIGLGIPRPDGSGCNLTRTAEVAAGPGPQLSMTAEAGVWCVRVYDLGFVPDTVSFSLQVTHF